MQKTIFAILLILGAAALLLSGLSEKLFHFGFTGQALADKMLRYQAFQYLVVAAVLGLTLALGGNRGYLSRGHIDAPVEPVRFFGIAPGSRWRMTGLQLLFVISLVTAIFIGLGVYQSGKAPGWALLAGNLHWVILLSLLNSAGEELIFRFPLAALLEKEIPHLRILWLSAILFGVPHYFGNPGGIGGIVLAGILGWVLVKSMLETRGMFWAVGIHFVQDVIIISSMFLL